MTRYFQRFTTWQRIQHVAVMVLFVLLSVTGLPQKYFEAGWAAWLLALMGGVDGARWLHRAAGLAFTGLMIAHFADLLVRLARGTASTAMVPHRKDLTDAVMTLRYYLGVSDRQARFDRYDYKHKFEYWGMALGSIIVVSTGFILLYPVQATQWMPGSAIPVAVVAHSSEGLLAFLSIVTWHVFNACLTPDVFPIDTSIFTGRISEDRMRHEHPLEYERLMAAKSGDGAAGDRPA